MHTAKRTKRGDMRSVLCILLLFGASATTALAPQCAEPRAVCDVPGNARCVADNCVKLPHAEHGHCDNDRFVQCDTDADCSCRCAHNNHIACVLGDAVPPPPPPPPPTPARGAPCDKDCARCKAGNGGCIADHCVKRHPGAVVGHCAHDRWSRCGSDADCTCRCAADPDTACHCDDDDDGSSSSSSSHSHSGSSSDSLAEVCADASLACPDDSQTCVADQCVKSSWSWGSTGHCKYDRWRKCESDADCGCRCSRDRRWACVPPPECDPTSSDAPPFCAETPDCGPDDFVWSQTIDEASGSPSASAVRLYAGATTEYVVPAGGFPAEFGGPVRVNVSAVSYDGYADRAAASQAHEQWRVVLRSGATVVWQSAYAGDVPDGVAQASVSDDLGGAELLTGFDSITLEHWSVGNPADTEPNSVVPIGICVEFEAIELPPSTTTTTTPPTTTTSTTTSAASTTTTTTSTTSTTSAPTTTTTAQMTSASTTTEMSTSTVPTTTTTATAPPSTSASTTTEMSTSTTPMTTSTAPPSTSASTTTATAPPSTSSAASTTSTAPPSTSTATSTTSASTTTASPTTTTAMMPTPMPTMQVPGACCAADGSCTDVASEPECDGTWLGGSTTCAANGDQCTVACDTVLECGRRAGCYGGLRDGLECRDVRDCPGAHTECVPLDESCQAQETCTECDSSDPRESLHRCAACVACTDDERAAQSEHAPVPCCPPELPIEDDDNDEAPSAGGAHKKKGRRPRCPWRAKDGFQGRCGRRFDCACEHAPCSDKYDGTVDFPLTGTPADVCCELRANAPQLRKGKPVHARVHKLAGQLPAFGAQLNVLALQMQAPAGDLTPEELVDFVADYYVIDAHERSVTLRVASEPLGEAMALAVGVIGPLAYDCNEADEPLGTFTNTTLLSGPTDGAIDVELNALLPKRGLYVVAVVGVTSAEQRRDLCTDYELEFVDCRAPLCPAELCAAPVCASARDCPPESSFFGCDARTGRCIERAAPPPRKHKKAADDQADARKRLVDPADFAGFGPVDELLVHPPHRGAVCWGAHEGAPCIDELAPHQCAFGSCDDTETCAVVQEIECDCQCAPQCARSSDCNDNDPFTIDVCDTRTHVCVHRPREQAAADEPDSEAVEAQAAAGGARLAAADVAEPRCTLAALDAAERAHASAALDRFGDASGKQACAATVARERMRIGAPSAFAPECCAAAPYDAACHGDGQPESGAELLDRAHAALERGSRAAQAADHAAAVRAACCALDLYAAVAAHCGNADDRWALADADVERSAPGPDCVALDDGHGDADLNEYVGEQREVTLRTDDRVRVVSVHTRPLARGGHYRASLALTAGGDGPAEAVVPSAPTAGGAACSDRERLLLAAALDTDALRAELRAAAALPAGTVAVVDRRAVRDSSASVAECVTLAGPAAVSARCPRASLVTLYADLNATLPHEPADALDALGAPAGAPTFSERTANTQSHTRRVEPRHTASAVFLLPATDSAASIRTVLRNHDCGVAVLLGSAVQRPASPLAVRMPAAYCGAFRWAAEGVPLLGAVDAPPACRGGADSGVVGQCAADGDCAVGGACVAGSVPYAHAARYYECAARGVRCATPAERAAAPDCCADEVRQWPAHGDAQGGALLFVAADAQ